MITVYILAAAICMLLILWAYSIVRLIISTINTVDECSPSIKVTTRIKINGKLVDHYVEHIK